MVLVVASGHLMKREFVYPSPSHRIRTLSLDMVCRSRANTQAVKCELIEMVSYMIDVTEGTCHHQEAPL